MTTASIINIGIIISWFVSIGAFIQKMNTLSAVVCVLQERQFEVLQWKASHISYTETREGLVRELIQSELARWEMERERELGRLK